MKKTIESWFEEAVSFARMALCLRSHCGAVLIKDGGFLGGGYNGPPRDDLALRRCNEMKASTRKPKTDRTCCLHAEWRALIDAVEEYPRAVRGSSLVFVRVDDQGNLLRSGNPYCTVCSRLTLDRGVSSWFLWHPGGIKEYSAAEYHELSQRYDELEASGAVAGGFSGAGALAGKER